MNDYINKFKEHIEKNYDECAASAVKMTEYIEGSSAYYHGEPVKTLYIPKIFSKEAYDVMTQAAEVLYGILEKIINRYLGDPDYRKLFPFPEEMEQLILCDRGYKSIIPILRMDIFLNEEDHSFKFCEINTDGTSGMVEDMELNNALKYNSSFIEYSKEHELENFELYDSWVKEFLKIYKDWAGGDNKPYVAIVDFLSEAYMSDLGHFKRYFEDNGCVCEICEIAELKYESGCLISPEGNKIDAVYRRAVTTDVFSRLNEATEFINAVKDNAVCCIGSFVTQIAHNKALFNIIRRDETLSFLDDNEKEFVSEHFPFTGYLDSSFTGTKLSISDVKNSRERWILKPLDLYGAREISVGADLDDNAWNEKVESLTDKGYIFQEYCYPYKSLNIDLTEDNASFSEWINMTGIYIYNGKAAGFFSRLAPDKVIASHYGGRTIATLVEK